MIRFLLLFCFLTIPFITCSQNQAVIKGKVIHTNGAKGKGVEIQLIELDKSTFSDAEGKFEFSNLPNRAFTLLAIQDNQAYDPVYVDLREKNEVQISITVGTMSFSLEEVRLKNRRISDQVKNSAIKADNVMMEC